METSHELTAVIMYELEVFTDNYQKSLMPSDPRESIKH